MTATHSLIDLVYAVDCNGAASEHRFAKALLGDSLAAVISHAATRSITDWPFENFWGNPIETLHSRLLGYFLDPQQEHGCGSFLLNEFIKELQRDKSLPRDHSFPVSECKLTVEKARIDLLLRSKGQFAIIIENKINGAVHQRGQLESYVDRMLGEGFLPHQIYVLYLPLNSEKKPDPHDLAAVQEKNVNYALATFEVHICNWLDGALTCRWPEDLNELMRDNLSQYRNLLRYLVNQNKRNQMDSEIKYALKQKIGDGELPSHSDFSRIESSLKALQRCVQAVSRGRLMLGVMSIFKTKGIDASFYAEKDGTQVKFLVESAYDFRFEQEVGLGIPFNDDIIVCLGVGEDSGAIAWVGYLRRQRKVNPEIETWLLNEAKKHLIDTEAPNAHWHTWENQRSVNYENCNDEAIVTSLAAKIIEMHTCLVQREDSLRVLGQATA